MAPRLPQRQDSRVVAGCGDLDASRGTQGALPWAHGGSWCGLGARAGASFAAHADGPLGAGPQKKPDSGYAKAIGMRNSLFVLAGTNFLGLLFSLLLPESKGRSLEEITKENAGDDELEA